MNHTLKVRETIDEEEIKSILLDDEIYDRITDDFCPDKEDYVLYKQAKFIGGYVDGKIVGLVIHHDREIHMQVLKQFRREHKRDLLHQAIELIDDDRIYAEIPALFPSVIEFAKQEGFKEDKIIKDCYLKNGKTYDTHIMVYEK